MTARLRFDDEHSARDALTFTGRATRIGADGVRLLANEGVLVMSAPVLAPTGLLDQTPTVLGLRILRVDRELQCDLTVATLTATDDTTALELPATAFAPSWAGVSPPQGGWEPVGSLDAAQLAARAQWGISAITHAVPDTAAEELVRSLRAQIWGEQDDALGGLPRGVALAASALGFIGGTEQANVSRSGRWTRVSLARGHVLVRGPAVRGLTDVRKAGA